MTEEPQKNIDNNGGFEKGVLAELERQATRWRDMVKSCVKLQKADTKPRKNPEPARFAKPGILKGEDKYYFYLL